MTEGKRQRVTQREETEEKRQVERQRRHRGDTEVERWRGVI